MSIKDSYSKMRLGALAAGIALAAVASAQDQELKPQHAAGPQLVSMKYIQQPKKDDNSVHHAAMHAEHWINHHTSAPHGKAYQHRVAKRNHNARKAVKHAEHWVDHHVSAPHKNPPPK